MRTFQAIGDNLIETDTPAVVLAHRNTQARLAALDTILPKPRTAPQTPAKRHGATVNP